MKAKQQLRGHDAVVGGGVMSLFEITLKEGQVEWGASHKGGPHPKAFWYGCFQTASSEGQRMKDWGFQTATRL